MVQLKYVIIYYLMFHFNYVVIISILHWLSLHCNFDFVVFRLKMILFVVCSSFLDYINSFWCNLNFVVIKLILSSSRMLKFSNYQQYLNYRLGGKPNSLHLVAYCFFVNFQWNVM